MKLLSQKPATSPGTLSKPLFFSPKQVYKSNFFQPKIAVGNTEKKYESEAVANPEKHAGTQAGLGQNEIIQRKAIENKQDEINLGVSPHSQHPINISPHYSIQKLQGNDNSIQRSTDEIPVSKPSLKLPSFRILSSKASKTDIKETLRDEGNSFSFGWTPDPGIFSWSAEVAIQGGEEVQRGSWVLGMLQLMKDYHFNILWGGKPQQKKCGDSFPDAHVRDVKHSMSGSPWFDDLKNPGPFTTDGEQKKTDIVDSPGALNIPYQYPEPDFPANFGSFDFGCSFISYLSVFNYNDPLSPEAWKHLRSVPWNTSLKGGFDASKENAEKLRVIGGGTTIEAASNGYPAGFPPKLEGLAAIDKICPISQCWNPKLKCAKVWVP